MENNNMDIMEDSSLCLVRKLVLHENTEAHTHTERGREKERERESERDGECKDNCLCS